MPDAGGARADAVLPIEAEAVSWGRDGRAFVDGVSLRLEAGPRTIILGPNGAGKTLLLRLLHGLIAPMSGRVRWAGRAPDEAGRRAQAMVFQRPVLLRRSAVANIRFALGGRGLPRAVREAKVAEALDLARLTHLAGRPARVLSGGEQQRLALARALALEPEVLFLDEPTASLDPASVLAIETLIEAAHRRGTKIVLVTHDLGQARRLADEVMFMNHGRIVEQAAAATFFDAPETEQAAAYLAGRIVL